MIPAPAGSELGSFRVVPDGPFIAGAKTTVLFQYHVGEAGLQVGAKVRIGVPNTGWEQPVPPQQRYWDELVHGAARRLAPFHPVNTTATVQNREGTVVVLDVMERMLAPDEDPAIAYWRWWITATIEGSGLEPGDVLEITYGDKRFGGEGVRIQTFAETHVNVVAFVQPGPGREFYALSGSPFYLDVVSGPATRANVVVPSTHPDSDRVPVRISITDNFHCVPAAKANVTLALDGQVVQCTPGAAEEIRLSERMLSQLSLVETRNKSVWGKPNPTIPIGPDSLQLFWGDLHAQSEHHVMHSQAKDFRQQEWSKGISSGTLDECYQYAREVALLDFVAMTDQGACLTDAWELCQGKVREYHEPGRFVTFKAYEAGAPVGHRNVIYSSDEVESPLDARQFSNFHPQILYDYYRPRGDAILIPHHVNTWTDWTFHDPELEPVMEIYSCWGQSEWPGLDLWNKGMTPGAGAQAAFGRGYRMGLIASSDNHVGMPGRSCDGDRQAHTPFKGGLCAVWAEELSREAIFRAIRQKRCYGTTGARIILRLSINGQPMGSTIRATGETVQAQLEIYGTDELRSVEIVSAGGTLRNLPMTRGTSRISTTIELPAMPGQYYYLRVTQYDNERAWTSPVFVE